MKTMVVVLMVVLGIAGAAGMSLRQDARITLDGHLNSPYISQSGGTAYLHITLATSDVRPVKRRPMNLAVVLDRSGSMQDQRKMEYAKSALMTLIGSLQSEDVFSFVVYDQDVDVLRPARRVGKGKRDILALVGEIFPRGSTNLGGGMIEGFEQAERNANSDYINRVILLSDGLANQGITDASELGRISRKYRSKGISLTTMGVGLDYNENLMVALSESGGGNYYFIESPHGLAAMLQKEFDCLSSVLAQNASIELTLGRGVRVNDVIGCEHRGDRNTHIIQVGDVYANEEREFTVELEIPSGEGLFTVTRGALRFENSEVNLRNVEPFTTTIRYTRDLVLIDKNRDMKTQAKVDIAISTRRVDRAMQMMDEGRTEEAAVELRSAQNALSISPAAVVDGVMSESFEQQEAKLRAFSKELDDNRDNPAKAKKRIQYENYKVQKKK